LSTLTSNGTLRRFTDRSLQAAAPIPTAAPIVEVALPPKFNGERSQVVGFVNAYCLFIQMRMEQVGERSKIS